jgi:hypothetical protein
MYLNGLPKKSGLYWLWPQGEESRNALICQYEAGSEVWFVLSSNLFHKIEAGDQYWDIPLVAPKDYTMGGSYSCYARDKIQLLEELHED